MLEVKSVQHWARQLYGWIQMRKYLVHYSCPHLWGSQAFSKSLFSVSFASSSVEKSSERQNGSSSSISAVLKPDSEALCLTCQSACCAQGDMGLVPEPPPWVETHGDGHNFWEPSALPQSYRQQCWSEGLAEEAREKSGMLVVCCLCAQMFLTS